MNIYRILYFSGTGNTEYVVNEIRRRLESKGHSCGILSADKLWAACGRKPGEKGDGKKAGSTLKEFLTDAGFLIIAYPVYASFIPKPLADILPLLPEGRGIKLAVISTCAMAGGDCCNLPAEKLKGIGYKPLILAYVKMPNNIKLPPVNYPPVKNGDELKSFYNSSAKAIEKITAGLLKEEKDIGGKGVGSRILGYSQRLAEKYLEKSFYKNLFATANCIKCKQCVSSCPTGNITFERGYPEFGPGCCLCLRCYNFCPVNAVQYTDKTRDLKKYPRYKGFNKWSPPRLYSV